MQNNNIIIKPTIKQKILSSIDLSSKEKDNFMRFIGYLTPSEQEELMLVI